MAARLSSPWINPGAFRRDLVSMSEILNERDDSAWLPSPFALTRRAFLKASGLPLSIWYDWQDDGPDPTQLEQNFGLITYTGQPKMAYVAAQTLTHELSNLRFSRRVSLASADDYALLFTPGESNKYKKQVLWTAGDPHTVTLAVGGSSVTITSMLGEQRTLPATDGKLVLELTGSPQYLALKPT